MVPLPHIFTRRTLTLLLGLIVILVALGSVTYYVVKQTQYKKSDANTQLLGDTEHTYTTLDGAPVTLGSYAGKIIYVNTWASWSPLSGQELIDLNEVAGEYQDKNIVFIALDRKETKEQASRYMATLPILPHLTFIIDTDDAFYAKVGGYAMPETIIFSKNGTTIYHDRTPQTKEQMREHVNAVLQSR
jgi:thiol-disulfide isomerase/thioredoxin